MDREILLSLHDRASPNFVAARFDFICTHTRFFSIEAIPPVVHSMTGSPSLIKQALLSPRKIISEDTACQNLIQFKNRIQPLARLERIEQENVFKFGEESADEDDVMNEDESEAGRVISLGKGEHRVVITLETLAPSSSFSFQAEGPARNRRGSFGLMNSSVNSFEPSSRENDSHFLDKTKEQITPMENKIETEFEKLVRLGEECSHKGREESKFSNARIFNEIGNVNDRKFVVLYLTDQDEIKSEPMVGAELVSFFEVFPNIQRFLVNNLFRNQVYDSFYFKLKILPIIQLMVSEIERANVVEMQVLKDIELVAEDLVNNENQEKIQEKIQEQNQEQNEANEANTPPHQTPSDQIKPNDNEDNEPLENKDKLQIQAKASPQTEDLKLQNHPQPNILSLNKNLSSISPSGISSGSIVNSSLLNLQFPPNKKHDGNSSNGSSSKPNRDITPSKIDEKTFLEYGELGVQPNWKIDSGNSKKSRRSRSSKRPSSQSANKKYKYSASKAVRSKAEIQDNSPLVTDIDTIPQSETQQRSNPQTPKSKSSNEETESKNTGRQAGFLLDLLGQPLKKAAQPKPKKKLFDSTRKPLRYKGEFKPKTFKSKITQTSRSKEAKRTKISGKFDLINQIQKPAGSSTRITSKEKKGNKLRKAKPFNASGLFQNQASKPSLFPATNNPQNYQDPRSGNRARAQVNQPTNRPGGMTFQNVNPSYRANLRDPNLGRGQAVRAGNQPRQNPNFTQQSQNNNYPFANTRQPNAQSSLFNNLNQNIPQKSAIQQSLPQPGYWGYNQPQELTNQPNFQNKQNMGWPNNNLQNSVNSSKDSPYQVPFQQLLQTDSQNFFFDYEKLKLQKNKNPQWSNQQSDRQGSLFEPSNALGSGPHIQQLFPDSGVQPRNRSRWDFVNSSQHDPVSQDPSKFAEHLSQANQALFPNLANSQTGQHNFKTPSRKPQFLFNNANPQMMVNLNTPNSNLYSPSPSPYLNSVFNSGPLFQRHSEAYMYTPLDPDISDTASTNTTSAFRLRLPANLWQRSTTEKFDKRQIDQLLKEDSEKGSRKDLYSEGLGSQFFGNQDALEMQTVDLSDYQSNFIDDRRATLNILPDPGIYKGMRQNGYYRNPHKGSTSSIGSTGLDSSHRRSFFGMFQPKVTHRNSLAQILTSPNPKPGLNRKASLGFREPSYRDQSIPNNFLDNFNNFDPNQHKPQNSFLTTQKRYSMQNLGPNTDSSPGGYAGVPSLDSANQKKFLFGLREIQERNEMPELQSENTSVKESNHNSPFRKVSKELGTLLRPISETRKSASKQTHDSQSKSSKVALFGRNSGMISGEFQSFEENEKTGGLFKFLGSQKQESESKGKSSENQSQKILNSSKFIKTSKNSKDFLLAKNKSPNSRSSLEQRPIFNFSQMRPAGKFPLTPGPRLRHPHKHSSLFSPRINTPLNNRSNTNLLKSTRQSSNKQSSPSFYKTLQKKRFSMFKDNPQKIAANPVQITSSKNPFLQGRKASFSDYPTPLLSASSHLITRKNSAKLYQLKRASIIRDYNNSNQNNPFNSKFAKRKTSTRTNRISKKTSKISKKKSIVNFPMEPRNSNKFVFFPIRKLSSLSKTKSKSKGTSKSPLKASSHSKQEEMMMTSIDSGNQKWAKFGDKKNESAQKGGTQIEMYQRDNSHSRHKSSKKIRKFSSVSRLAQNKSHFSKSPHRQRGSVLKKNFAKIENTDSSKKNPILSREINYSNNINANAQDSSKVSLHEKFITKADSGNKKSTTNPISNPKAKASSNKQIHTLFKDSLNNKSNHSQPLQIGANVFPQKVIQVPVNYSLFKQTYNKPQIKDKSLNFASKTNKTPINLNIMSELKRSLYSASGRELNKLAPLSPMTQHTLIMPSSEAPTHSLFKPEFAFQASNLSQMQVQTNPKWSDYANIALMKLNNQTAIGDGIFANLKPNPAQTNTRPLYASGNMPPGQDPRLTQMQIPGNLNVTQATAYSHLRHNPFVKNFSQDAKFQMSQQGNPQMDRQMAWRRYQMALAQNNRMGQGQGRRGNRVQVKKPQVSTNGFRTFPSNSFLETDMKLGNSSGVIPENSLFNNLSSGLMQNSQISSYKKVPNQKKRTGNQLMQFLDRRGSTLQRNFEAGLFTGKPKIAPSPNRLPASNLLNNISQTQTSNQKTQSIKKPDQPPTNPTQPITKNQKQRKEDKPEPEEPRQKKNSRNQMTNKNSKKRSPYRREYEPRNKNKRKRKKQQKYLEVDDEDSGNFKNINYIENQNNISYTLKKEGEAKERQRSRDRERKRRNRNRNRRRRRNY